MRYSFKIILITVISATISVSCNRSPRDGKGLSKSEKEYIRGLGLLEENETIFLFDGQSGFETSGNFFTDKRIATYWIDKRDEDKSSIDFAFYNEIDTILTKDLSRALTYASYMEVVKNDGKTFKVYVDGDSTEVQTFFDRAMSEWRIKNNR